VWVAIIIPAALLALFYVLALWAFRRSRCEGFRFGAAILGLFRFDVELHGSRDYAQDEVSADREHRGHQETDEESRSATAGYDP
jgi:hypothetical protein